MISLSYVISTRNRLSFLKITLQKLINEAIQGEEIVVVDGASTDGSMEYLLGLYKERKIHQFISEPDRNQAEGWNKGFLLAKGNIIKKIIDDDVYDYESIRLCAEYIKSHPDTDLVISNDLSVNINQKNEISKNSRLHQFNKWSLGLIPSFTFGDVHMLITKTAVEKYGLYDPAYIMLDWEYALRLSFSRANIVYYTGYNALSLGHEGTISANKNIEMVHEQAKKACNLYNYPGDRQEISQWSRFKIFIGKIILKKSLPVVREKDDFKELYEELFLRIKEINSTNNSVFIPKS